MTDADQPEPCGTMAVMELSRFSAGAVELHQRLVRVTYAVSGDLDLAEECAQEALLRAWQRLGDGEQIDSVEAWCITVALNCWRSAQRRSVSDRHKSERLRSRAATDAAASADHTGAGLGVGDDVRTAVLALPLRQREAVVLHYLLDLGIAEIATTTQRSEGAVKNALHHARRSLARALPRPAAPEPAEDPR